MRNFIWGATDIKRTWHTVAWEDICRPKDQGGLGIRNVHLYNKSLLMKVAWNMLASPSAFWVQVLKSKYKCGTDSIPNVNPKQNFSITWRGILAVWKDVVSGMQWNIGNGKRIRFWTDPWLPSGVILQNLAIAPLNQTQLLASVSDLSNEYGTWRLDLFKKFIPPQFVNQIAGCAPANPLLGDDSVSWPLTSNGIFSTKSAYDFLLSHIPTRSAIWTNVWKWEGPHRIRCFLWLLYNDGLKTNDKRARWSMDANDVCPLCSSHIETPLHVLRDCDRSKEVWQRLNFSFGNQNSQMLPTWLNHYLKPSHERGLGAIQPSFY
ncbi:unnamed protein product [Trifolium pratense]|uniref:Uncharacterized protein n=1 Tax=Trifolium pratense TaxID=57577 RepID=A0ACB0J1V3_TRIPR|nr:unnamed protein product [Trifolium pratense]